jgi:hypothetical protein
MLADDAAIEIAKASISGSAANHRPAATVPAVLNIARSITNTNLEAKRSYA